MPDTIKKTAMKEAIERIATRMKNELSGYSKKGEGDSKVDKELDELTELELKQLLDEE